MAELGSNRTHAVARKSRHGCSACKARKVKCDEVKPVCSNCRKFDVVCEQLNTSHGKESLISHSASSTGSPDSADGARIPSKRGKGRPRKFQGQTFAQQSPNSSTELSKDITGEQFYSKEQTQLLIHYISSTARTLCNTKSFEDPNYHHFTNEIPSLGLTHPFVFNFISAIAGLHLSYNTSDAISKADHRTKAGQYFQKGIAEYGKQFGSIKDISPKFIAATFVCYYTLALGPSSFSDILVCDLNEVEGLSWLKLLWGVRAMNDDNKKSSNTSTPSETPARIDIQHRSVPNVGSRWRGPVAALKDFQNHTNSASHQSCHQMLTNMEKTFRALEAQDEADENIFVLGWLYKLDTEFVAALHQTEPYALLVMGFYTVLLGKLEEENWWVRGWADHILKVIKQPLPEDCMLWLAWPIEEAAVRARTTT